MSPNDLNTKTSLGFIGLGALGRPIANNLIEAGFQLKIFTRQKRPNNTKKLESAKYCENPKEASNGCMFLLICVTNSKAVEEILFGPQGAQYGLPKGSTIIDFSTISPKKAKLFSKKLQKFKIKYIDAPVTGGTEAAKAGTLTIFLGASNEDLKKIFFILETIGNSFYTFGTVGKGQEVKALNQILVAGTYAAVAEAIALGEALKLPMDTVVEALQKGAAGSWALSNRSKFMLDDEYPLGFKLGLHNKDLSIALNTAKSLGLHLPITSKVKKLEEQLIAEGYQNEDISVIKRSLKK